MTPSELVADDIKTRAIKLIRSAAMQWDPDRALGQLLDNCLEATSATAGRLYRIDLEKASYVVHGSGERPSETPRCEFILSETPPGSALRTVIDTRSPVRLPSITSQPRCRNAASLARSRMIVPILRDQVCLGLIDLDSSEPDHFTGDHETLVSMAADIGLLLMEKANTLNLLKELQRPVSFAHAEDEYLDDVLLMINAASRMPIIILSEKVDDALVCLGTYGLSDVDPSDLRLEPISAYPPYNDAMKKKVRIEKDMTKPEVAHLIRALKPDEEQVQRLCVVPILMGGDHDGEVFGTISFAVKCPHDFTKLERNGLQAIANAVGVAIENYRNFQATQAARFEYAKVGAAIMTMEVSQAVRHEAQGLLGSCQGRIAGMISHSAPLSKDQQVEILDGLERISQQLQRVHHSLQKIKTATKPPDREYMTVELNQLWHEAIDLVGGLISSQRIQVVVQGSARAKVYAEYLRFAFLNIISNSIDAFRDAKSRNRRIDITIQSDDRTNSVKMRYSDNAGGIDPSKLGPVPEGQKILVPSAIFQQGVTSKAEGSGFGMFLVRKSLADHRGSINLVDHRGGVVFDLILPKDKNRT